MRSPLFRRSLGIGDDRFLVAPSIVVLVIASAVAVVAWPTIRHGFSLCHSHVVGAGHIDQGVDLVLLCGFFGSIALVALRPDPRNVAVALLVVAVILSVAIGLVLLDSASYAVITPSGVASDFLNCATGAGTELQDVSYLYPVWGGAVALLLLQAVRGLVCPRPTSESDAGSESEQQAL